jgi:hypothetical protein
MVVVVIVVAVTVAKFEKYSNVLFTRIVYALFEHTICLWALSKSAYTISFTAIGYGGNVSVYASSH